ncbi:MAG TPA: tetratricopeptide repeat protein [Stellaceae bacterium]|jgi:hypothetical protein|nr:tetratricopeptide repeat protein [Stellaceae bacterium]
MPAFGVLLLLAQIACAVHIVRSGRPYFWIYIVVLVPMVGMAAYLIAELLPELMGSRTARHAASEMKRTIDPTRGLREATRRAVMTPTIENKAALAEEYLRAGQPTNAAAFYRETLTGIHSTDPALMLGLARALFAQGDSPGTEAVLRQLREANPDYHSPDGHLLFARSLEEQGKPESALSEYTALINYYPGQEARCRYGILLRRLGRPEEARRIFAEICHSVEYGPSHQRRAQREWYDIAKRGGGNGP